MHWYICVYICTNVFMCMYICYMDGNIHVDIQEDIHDICIYVISMHTFRYVCRKSG